MPSLPRENSNHRGPDRSDKVLIVGGGAAGMAAASALAKRGVGSIVIEERFEVGGLARELACKGTKECVRCDVCLVTDLIEEVAKSSLVQVLTQSQISNAKRNHEFFEIEVVDHRGRKNSYNVRAIILATGIEPLDAASLSRYGCGTISNVFSALDIERELNKRGKIGAMDFRKVAIIQCVGSRGERGGVEYCSVVCCKYALRLAKLLNSQVPDSSISFFFMDWRACDGAQRDLKSWAESSHARLIRSRPAEIFSSSSGKPMIRYATQEEEVQEEEFDMVILSVGIKPAAGISGLATILDLQLDGDGFIRTALGTTETSSPGIYAAGSATGPCDVERSVTSGIAAASEAASLLERSGRLVTVALLGEADNLGQDSSRSGVNIVQVPWNGTSKVHLTGSPGNFRLWLTGPDRSTVTECDAVIVSLSNRICQLNPKFVSLDEFETNLIPESGGRKVAFVLQDEEECSARAQHHERVLNCALKLKQMDSKSEATIIAPEFIAFGQIEKLYKECQEQGVLFVRQNEFQTGVDKEINALDPISKAIVRISADTLVLAGDYLPPGIREALHNTRLNLEKDGRAKGRPVKWKPSGCLKRGVFLCGSPWSTAESRILDLRAAIEEAHALIVNPESNEFLAKTDDEKCSACLTCVRTCPFEAPYINLKGVAEIDSALCQGCGICVSMCPSKAISLKPFEKANVQEEDR